MPTRANTHIDRALTNISVQYFNDPANFVADLVFPRVPVQMQSDRYFQYLREDWFRDDARKRAPGSESAGGEYDVDNTPSYFCERYAFHKDITEEERVNSDPPLQPDLDATMFVVDKIRLNKENNWARQFFVPGVWQQNLAGGATTSAGTTVTYWNDYVNSDPLKDIQTMSTNMSELTGKRPNTLVLGRRVYDALLLHPDIMDRIKFTQTGILTKALLGAFFDVERILVAEAIQNIAEKRVSSESPAAHESAALKMRFMLGNNVLLCYSTPTPGLRIATAGYIFTWVGLMGANALGGRINRIPIPLRGIGTERIECELAYDMKVVAKDMGAFIHNAVNPTLVAP